VTDRNESDRATVTPVEGVRILGAKETPTNRDTDLTAEAGTLDLEQVAREEREPQENLTRRAEVPIVGSADERSREPGDVEPSVEPPGGEHPPLPHWIEPPTGAIPGRRV